MKRNSLSSVIVAVTMSIGCIATNQECTAVKAVEVTWGDVNADSSITVDDAMLILRKFTDGMTGTPVDYYGNWAVADVNSDGYVNVADAQLVLTKFVENMIGNSFYFPVESPLIYGTKVYATESWNAYCLPDNAHENLLGVIKANSLFTITQYMGDCWYMMENANFSEGYINIKTEDWHKRFYYEGEMPEVIETTTTAEATTTVTTTTVLDTVTDDGAITTTDVSTDVESETTTSDNADVEVVTTTTEIIAEEGTTTEASAKETTTTEAPVTETTTTEAPVTETTTTETTAPQKATDTETTTNDDVNIFDIGDKIEFKAVSWVLFDNALFDSTPVRWMKNGERFTIIDRIVYEDHATYCIVFEGESEDKKYILTTKGEKLYFEKIS